MCDSTKLDRILERLTEIETLVKAMPSYEAIATTASRDEARDILDGIDTIYDLIAEADQRLTLDQIRHSYRQARAS
jgi:hypothetical protein